MRLHQVHRPRPRSSVLCGSRVTLQAAVFLDGQPQAECIEDMGVQCLRDCREYCSRAATDGCTAGADVEATVD
eukprot:9100993-Lingulodinium_polyedra.AAC.1